ncbi:helix-turn-helix transcriptional regulator [Streptomyces hydrogenans]|uniref:Transcriptional regulator n=1 Tax=Streptomyces hydrogenans TaxID=1873719 RepID=A0ABQ3PSW6_9ACTN|nr:LuxR family transcriptional regulator [Streptomyces hydrogenans]GHF98158.1 transcriptional regulator [Streptomyces hydrogenans]GHI28100.1 transcriptional regulator [Streptomyces hydrogenans]
MNWPDRNPDWEELGLGPDELRLYEALLAAPRTSNHPRSASLRPSVHTALADASGLSVERVTAALGTLTDQGFVRLVDDHGAMPIPVSPSLALRNLIHLRQAELLSRSARLELFSASVDRLASRLPVGVPEEASAGIEVVRGREAITERADALIAAASVELTLLDRPPYASSPDGGMPAPLAVANLVARGVRVRVVVDREGLDLPGRAHGLNELTEQGVEIRVAADLPTKLIAVDGRDSLLPPTDTSDPTATALAVKDAVLRNVLAPLFETVWERAMPIGQDTREHVTVQDREILTLLASGFKDEAIARQLNVHVHTVRRRIKALLLLLDAQTRFQAGVQALRRGWLTA